MSVPERSSEHVPGPERFARPARNAARGDERKEAEKREEEARIWISGLEAVKGKIGIKAIYDLSATPFFLRGSGYSEGTLFPWVVSDFSLIDAIESGIVKVPRVPVADDSMTGSQPTYRNLWHRIRDHLPKKGRKTEALTGEPKPPVELEGALQSLYGNYQKYYESWEKSTEAREKGQTPPVFIVVCNNTNVSKLVFDYIAGWEKTLADDSTVLVPGKLDIFSNVKDGRWIARPNTILIDSEQLESGDAMSKEFKKIAMAEIEEFKADCRGRLMQSCTVMTRADWEAIPSESRALLEEANIRPLLLDAHSDIPGFIGHLYSEFSRFIPVEALVFQVSAVEGDSHAWNVSFNGGAPRRVDVPWKEGNEFIRALEKFWELAENGVEAEADQMALYSYASTVGDALSKALFDDLSREAILAHGGDEGGPPLISIESDSDLILSLPFELIRHEGVFLVRQARVDLIRSVITKSEKGLLPPDRPFSLVVNVSAPEDSKLKYEDESYRIAKVFQNHREVFFTELGAVDDLVEAVEKHKPMGIHFSGHGSPAKLVFENDVGDEKAIRIEELVRQIKTVASEHFPKFFYLASCHGNSPGKVVEGEAGTCSSAAHLQKSGIAQVVGYFGPVLDELSTLAEETIYRAIADGEKTRKGVRTARKKMDECHVVEGACHHKDEERWWCKGKFPFAWAQLVLYQSGEDYPLGIKAEGPKGFDDAAIRLERVYDDNDRRVLATGSFIGRRKDIYRFRRAIRDEGRRVFVFQGLGGLGKSALSFKAINLLKSKNPNLKVITVWCSDLEGSLKPEEDFLKQFSDSCLKVFGPGWADVVRAVDLQAGEPPVKRLVLFLSYIAGQDESVVVCLDNLESLLSGKETGDPEAFAKWKTPELEEMWLVLRQMGEKAENLKVLASCRYRNDAFKGVYYHVSEMENHALLRMTAWFTSLRRLSAASRVRLVDMLYGHPRAVEYLDDIIKNAIDDWVDTVGPWTTPTTEQAVMREWDELVKPALPELEEKLVENLLLDKIWENVLDDGCRRMLVRMTILFRPCDWRSMLVLGEPDEPEEKARRNAEKLRKTSLLTQVEVRTGKDSWEYRFSLHPIVINFIKEREGVEWETLRKEAYLSLGTFFEERIKTSKNIMDILDGGNYIFQAGEFNRAYELLGPSSDILHNWGRFREGLAILRPFLDEPEARNGLSPELMGRLLGTMGSAYYSLGQVKKAIEYHEKALVISREIDDRRGEGADLGNLGIAYSSLGQVEKAKEYLQKSILIAEEIKDPRMKAISENALKKLKDEQR